MINSLHTASVGHTHQSPLATAVAKRTDNQPAAEGASQFDRFLAEVLAKIEEKTPGLPGAPTDAHVRGASPDQTTHPLGSDVRATRPVYPTEAPRPMPVASGPVETR